MEMDGETVSVRPASGIERPVIESLSQFYIYDFSELEPSGFGELEFGDQGRYSSLPDMDSYWCIEGFHPLLIRVKERLVGFALINNHSRRGEKIEHNVGEVLRSAKTSTQRSGNGGCPPSPGTVSRSLGGCRGRA